MSLAAPDVLAELEALRALTAQLQAELYAKNLYIEKLKAQLASLKRARFGRSSEKLDHLIEQLELAIADLEESEAHAGIEKTAARPIAPSPSAGATAKSSLGRKPLPAHLPSETIVHKPDCTCPTCGGSVFSTIGTDEREVLEYVPSHFKRVVHLRPKLSCRTCETIIQAPMPSLPIERGRPGPSLLAHVLVSKYCDHLPLHRQSDIYAREGVDLDRSTLAGWVGAMAALLQVLSDRIGTHARAGETVHADDTPVPVLDPGRGKTKTGRLWTIVRDERPWGSAVPPAAFYAYSADRKGERAQHLLSPCRGFLHADAYAGFDKLYAGHPLTGETRLIQVACWAHARRDLYNEFLRNRSPSAERALDLISELFAVEAGINGLDPETRLAARLARSAPLLEILKRHLDTTLARISGKSELAKAIRYMTSRWKALTVYATDGRLEMSNNAAERAIRPLALGRKNYLFSGSDAGGARAAVIYTIVETCKMNGLNPQAYLADVIERIADHPVNRIDELLPWNWTPRS